METVEAPRCHDPYQGVEKRILKKRLAFGTWHGFENEVKLDILKKKNECLLRVYKGQIPKFGFDSQLDFYV